MTLSWYLEKAPELCEEVAVPELEQLVKKSRVIRKRAAAVPTRNKPGGVGTFSELSISYWLAYWV
jgi:hypothetical protein